MAKMSVHLTQSLSQSQRQVQVQKMSQKQIMSLNVLSMSDMELRNEAYNMAGRNPALVIVSDAYTSDIKKAVLNSRFSDNTRYSTVSESGQLASDNFQSALESCSDTRETLRTHLMEQCNIAKLTPDQKRICTALIDNLDSKGWHILSPYSLLKNDSDTNELLEECISIVQHFDPVGTCCKNYEESLLVQARVNGDAPECALFILDGHFDFLNPPLPQKIIKKIKDYTVSLQKMSFADNTDDLLSFTVEDAEDALSYIRTLNPFPASGF